MSDPEPDPSQPPQNPPQNPFVWAWLAASFVCLLVASWCDNIRGPILPRLAAVPEIGMSGAGDFMAAGSTGALLVNVAMIWILNRVSAVSTAIGFALAAAAVGVATLFATTKPAVMIVGFVLGMTICSLGTMTNVLLIEGVSPAKRGKWIATLHSMYGVASMLAAWGAGQALSHGAPWSDLYLGAVPLQVGLALFLGVLAWRTRRLWGRRSQTAAPGPQKQGLRLATLPLLAIAVAATYVAGELATTNWLTSYLVKARGMEIDEASGYLTAFFLVLTIGRLLCSFVSTPERERQLLFGALLVPAGLLIVGLAGGTGWTWSFALAGALAPFYPLFLTRVSRRFPDEWRTLWIWAVAAMNVAIGATNFAFGRLAEAVGIQASYYAAPVLLLAAAGLLFWYVRLEAAAERTADRQGTAT